MPRMPRLALAAVLLALSALGAPTAQAGSYEIVQCADPRTGLAVGLTSEWSAPGYETYDGCAERDPFGFLLGPTRALAPNTSAQQTLSIPSSAPHVRLKRAELWYGSVASSGSSSYVLVYSGGTRYFEERAGTDHSSNPVIVAPTSPTRDLSFHVFCSSDASTVCTYPRRDVLVQHRARLLLEESVPPTGTVEGGSLLQPGPRRGWQSLRYSVHDEDSGIARIQVLLGGHTIADHRLEQSDTVCPRTTWAGCQRSRSNEEVEFPTRAVPDGTYAASLRIYDLAGNSGVVHLGTVTLDNVTESGRSATPDDPSRPNSNAANGSHATRSARITLARPGTARPRLSLPHGRSASIRGRLLAPEGRAISGALLRVSERVSLPGVPANALGSVRTRRDGSWSLPLAAGPSRTLTVSYTAFAGDPKPADTARVRVDVRAGARLTPSATRLRNGDTLALRGGLLGHPIPRSGKLVDVQAWDLGKWRTFAVARADRGPLRGLLPLRAHPRHDHLMRALVRQEDAYPYAEAASRPIRVTVSP